MTKMHIRQLRAGEESKFLELLDGWPFSDGRLGSDFFRKYVDDDSRYQPENVWIASDATDGGTGPGKEDELVSCVQIFPRDLWLGDGKPVPVGGIGTVFTRPSHRRQGLAEQLLHAAAADMQARGMHFSLLSATRVGWYSRFGWQPLPNETVILERAENTPMELSRSEFDESRDLADVQKLHLEYLQDRPGTLTRTEGDWASSLQLAGNPDEDFWIVRKENQLVAYLRGARLGKHWVATEWGRAQGGAESLAQLFATATAHAKGQISSARLQDQALERELAKVGVALRSEPDPTNFSEDSQRPVWMVRDLQERSKKLAEMPSLAPETFCFWTSDRF